MWVSVITPTRAQISSLFGISYAGNSVPSIKVQLFALLLALSKLYVIDFPAMSKCGEASLQQVHLEEFC